MMELKNLHQLGLALQSKFKNGFVADDAELPDSFKNHVLGLGEYSFSYKKHMVQLTSSNLEGYIPNVWFVIASYFVDYYNEIVKYKELFSNTAKTLGVSNDERDNLLSLYPKLTDLKYKAIPTKERNATKYKECQSEASKEIADKVGSLLTDSSLSEDNKKFLTCFVSDYTWWFGGKTIDRGDFYVSPILTLANVVNASHSYVAELCKYLSQDKVAAAILRHPNAIIIKDSLPTFFVEVFKYLYNKEDKLTKIFEHIAPGQTGSCRYAYDYNGQRQTNFFIKGQENFDNSRKGDFDEFPYVYNGEKYFLSKELAKNRPDSKREVSFYGLKPIIEELYPSYILDEESDIYILSTTRNMSNFKSLQQIFYGAPGTGKSHEISIQTKGKAVVRTTFHPDSDYSTFVGAYKPVMGQVRKSVVIGVDEKEVKPLQGNSEYEGKIQYSFVKQAFLKAYLGAWRKYAESKMSTNPTTPDPQFLVIEEINRGNCAQIFGDIFQLLDREDSGFSSYPIEADTDLQQEIARAFSEEEEYMIPADLNIDNAVEDYTSNYGATLSEDIINGRVMLLPPNMYIWATMNTSDQSLFPIDSAFKRRWDWTYMPIDTTKESWVIDVDGTRYSWTSFLDKINSEISDTTSSEDKQLGFYFCKAQNGVISAEKFVSKVLFYLYNDVFKDYGLEREFFKNSEDNNKTITFQSLYNTDGSVKTDMVTKLLVNLGVESIGNKEGYSDANNNDESVDTKGDHKETLVAVTVNGERFDSNNRSQFDLYLDVIKKLGVSTIAPIIENMKYRRMDSPMATKTQVQKLIDNPSYSYVEADGYYFVKGANGYTLVRILEDLKTQQNLDIEIEYR